ncbi:MAG TPA: SCO family protein, partial [Polyangia bacterium]|nr:SCO family protein [Polyangia bacterium]
MPSRTVRWVTHPLFWIAAVGLLFGVPLGRSVLRRAPTPPATLGSVPDFTLTDQTGHPFGTQDLRGRVW